MLNAPALKELPCTEERKEIVDHATRTLEDAQMLLEFLDELDERQAATNEQFTHPDFRLSPCERPASLNQKSEI